MPKIICCNGQDIWNPRPKLFLGDNNVAELVVGSHNCTNKCHTLKRAGEFRVMGVGIKNNKNPVDCNVCLERFILN